MINQEGNCGNPDQLPYILLAVPGGEPACLAETFLQFGWANTPTFLLSVLSPSPVPSSSSPTSLSLHSSSPSRSLLHSPPFYFSPTSPYPSFFLLVSNPLAQSILSLIRESSGCLIQPPAVFPQSPKLLATLIDKPKLTSFLPDSDLSQSFDFGDFPTLLSGLDLIPSFS